ncbi:hypothetical protein BBJ29_001694 [Phytophthora kernoviae]|uniref:SCP domain-containing protein n=1 Tax=Phytophthora kernoviae TaxID=325452 RepID=A0A3F2S3H8_9STRA|nr:hypothetical protein BBJ29_001694 [Phytophthora kernoviae]RLN68775.1 hypothetical protein BBP00_00000813 [Phytophthora kernoviae]
MLATARSSVNLLLVVVGVISSANAVSNLRHTSRGLQTYTQSDEYQSQMLALVNKQRAAQGLSSLCLNSKLLSSSARHSDDMAKNNYMAHNGSDGSTMEERITEAGFIWTAVGENVAAGQEDVESVMTAWMNSPEHKANILGDYKMFGSAYAYNADTEYKHYWTQDFGTGDDETCESSSSDCSASSTTSDSADQTQQQVQQNDEVAGEASTTADTTAPITQETTAPATTTPTPATDAPTATTGAPTTDAPIATTTTPTTSGCK